MNTGEYDPAGPTDITYDHIADLNALPRWKWVNGDLAEVDLRKANKFYLMKIYEFMEKHENKYLYTTTGQFEYVRDRLEIISRREEAVRKALQRRI